MVDSYLRFKSIHCQPSWSSYSGVVNQDVQSILFGQEISHKVSDRLQRGQIQLSIKHLLVARSFNYLLLSRLSSISASTGQIDTRSPSGQLHGSRFSNACVSARDYDYLSVYSKVAIGPHSAAHPAPTDGEESENGKVNICLASLIQNNYDRWNLNIFNYLIIKSR